MSLSQQIMSLLKEEGYKVNEAVRDALADFLDVVEEETEGVEDAADEEVEEEDED